MSKNLCIIILSHSGYTDIWPLTLKSYHTFLPDDLNIDKFITSDKILNEKDEQLLEKFGFRHIYYPQKISWGKALIDTLRNNQLEKYKYFLFSFDDLVLLKKVNTESLTHYLSEVEKNDLPYLKLVNTHDYFRKIFSKKGSKSYFALSEHDSYRGSLVFSIWKKEEITRIASYREFDTYSPWMYERNINRMIGKGVSYYCVSQSLLSFANTIIKGKVNKYELALAENKLNTTYHSTRKQISQFDLVSYYIKTYLFMMGRALVPHKVFNSIRKLRQSLKTI